MLYIGGPNHRWPTIWPGGYITPTAWGGPNASQRGKKSAMAHKWDAWLQNPCRLPGPRRFRAASRGPQPFRAEDKIRSGPQVGRVAT